MPPHTGTPGNSTNQVPLYHSVLLSISGDSKISLQHTSVQQLSAIPEDRELVDLKSEQVECEENGYGPVVVEDEFEEPHILIQDPAPDGGYGWVIVLASFLSNLIVDGIAYTFGLFFEKWVLHFDTTKSSVAICGSLLNGFYLSVGPLVSSLANRFGCRFVSILGAFIASGAFVLSTLAPNLGTLYLTYGVFGGIGMGMIYLPAIVSVGYYFTTKRAFATGMAVCGSGIGAFLFAPFCQYMLTVTTWQNTLLVLAALVLCCAAFGSLIKPLHVHAQAVLEEDLDPRQLQAHEVRKPLLQRIAEEKRRRLLAHSNSQFLLMMQQSGSLDIHDSTFNELKARLTMNTEPGVHSTLYLDQLFSQSPAPTPTPSVVGSSALQSQNQLVPEKHQLSPILEKKVIVADASGQGGDSGENSTEELNSSSTLTENTEKLKDVEIDNETKEVHEMETIEEEEAERRELEEEADEEINLCDEIEQDGSSIAVTAPGSPDKDTCSVYQSSSTLPQSPEPTPARCSSFTSSGALTCRTRRSSTLRTVSDSSTNNGHVSNSANFLNPNVIHGSGLGTSGQIPVQVILSTTPNHTSSKECKDLKRNTSTQTIPVRPLAKKDIFYSGSSLQIHSSVQQMAESGISMGQSVVSIPARDIITRVQRHIQQLEQEEMDSGANQMPVLRQRKNVCNKILKVLCPFKEDCYRQKQISNDEDNAELQSLDAGGDKADQDKTNSNLGCWPRFISKLPPSMGSILNEMLDFSLLRDSSAFTILAISNIFGMMGFYVPFIFITQYAASSVKDGDGMVTAERAAFLISVIGITNTFGRLLFGFLSDRINRTGHIAGFKITALGLNNICVILSGLAVIATPFCTTYLAVMIDCVFFGLFISAYICLTSIILVDMLGLDKLTNAFGLLCLFRGAASIVGPPLAGALFDATQSYYITFAASGLLLIFSSIMAFFITIREHTVDQEPDNECEA